jgi:hypothetical protein
MAHNPRNGVLFTRLSQKLFQTLEWATSHSGVWGIQITPSLIPGIMEGFFMKNKRYSDRNRISVILVLAGLMLAFLCSSASAGDGFSFLFVGDTRTEVYLPGDKSQSDWMSKLLKARYGSTPELFFDPTGTGLAQATVKESENSILTLYYKDGWPHMIISSENGSRVVMRESGRKWVFDRIVVDVVRGAGDPSKGSLFCIHGGDIPLFGYQGATRDDSPYWQLFEKELLVRLPPATSKLHLPGRVFAAVGNHDSWGDDDLKGFLTTMPWLADFGVTSQNRIYSFPYRNCWFIFLDSGGNFLDSGASALSSWSSKTPDFEAQMSFLQQELSKARKHKANHVFVIYHKPSFVQVGHDPLPADQNPHSYLKPFARDLNIVVFNSHVHTSEHYQVDGINYFVMGGGGAPQAFDLAENPSPEEELYWAGKERVEEYNYLDIDVDGPHLKASMHRFRPNQTQHPVEVLEMLNQ